RPGSWFGWSGHRAVAQDSRSAGRCGDAAINPPPAAATTSDNAPNCDCRTRGWAGGPGEVVGVGAGVEGEERQVVGEVVGGAFADLVEAEELVLDGAVVEVEAAHAQEDAGEGDPGLVRCGSAAFDQLDEADDQDGGAEEVEEAVGDEADRRGRAVVEVVPAKELVEDDLVERSGEADADQDAWPEQGGGGRRG